ncbi:hypothetical protein ACIP4V_20465 [Streptomyces albidoflavus]
MAATPGGSRWPGAVTARNGPRHALTSRLNVLPFDDGAGRAALLTEILGRPLPATATLHPPFCTDHGLRIDVGEHVFVNQGCTFYDQGGTALGDGVLVGPRTSLISSDHPLAAPERADYVTRPRSPSRPGRCSARR